MDKRLALLIAALAALPAVAAHAQTLPLVSRTLQFHAAPGVGAGAAAGEADDPRYTEVPVILSTIPRTTLAPGAAILEPRIDPQTGLYIGNRGEPGRDPAILPEAPVRAAPESLPPLTVGQVYLPPWWDQVRNAAGGFGPADVPPPSTVTPDDLRILPPPDETPDGGLPNGTLPDGPPPAPVQRGTAPQPPAQPAVAPPAPPAVQPQTPPVAAEPDPRPAPAAAQPQAAPIPLVSRRLNFQY